MPTTMTMDDLSVDSASAAVVFAVARVRDVDPLQLSPFGEQVNPIALDRLLEDDSFAGTVTVQYEGYEITVTSDGEITLTQ